MEAAEAFFWHDLCDNYIEIAKKRLYGDEGYDGRTRRGAQFALYQALLSTLKIMAPVVPHITEEIHSLFFAEREKAESIHTSAWPAPPSEWCDGEAEETGSLALSVIEAMRKVKSIAKVSVAAPVGTLGVVCDDASWIRLGPLKRELLDVSNAKELVRAKSPDTSFMETDKEGLLVSAELLEPPAE